jgi:hypothetical protein
VGSAGPVDWQTCCVLSFQAPLAGPALPVRGLVRSNVEKAQLQAYAVDGGLDQVA